MTVPANLSSLANLGSLVVGYGNPLRSDDGIGWVIAGRVAADPRFAGIEVLQRHQLTPELALDVSRADLVVLVDARSGPPAGTIAVERVDPAGGTGTTWSHHLGPPNLVALARELYGRAPEVHVIGVGVASLEVGERLSPAVERVVDDVMDVIARLVHRTAAAEPQGVTGSSHA
ncbi:MAG: hydrogenase maturation protease [Chloroflexota bacterium]